jgi:hypothetical protein
MTNKAVQAFLAARGKVGLPLVDYVLAGDDSEGPVVQSFALWNEATLGPAPTPADMATMRTLEFTATSRRKDVLATCALIVRARGIAAWNAMTLQQKVTAAFAEADVWVNIRDFIESNT